ncbi:MAG: hypothetical protein IH594_04720, partial [Bacteroidales bacterium]|nr:hypothetical protein [Bacteroidales bacterium]
MKEPFKVLFCMKPGGHFNYPLISRIPASSKLIRILSGIFLFFGSNFSAYPQGEFSVGLLPKVNLSYAFPKNIKIVGGYESRQAFFERDKAGDAMFYYDYLLSDLSALISLKTGFNKSLSGGFLVRIQGSQVNYRFLQQFSLVSELDAMRIGQRFAADQTLKSDGTWEYRGRYRFTLEKPLSGDKVDPG